MSTTRDGYQWQPLVAASAALTYLMFVQVYICEGYRVIIVVPLHATVRLLISVLVLNDLSVNESNSTTCKQCDESTYT